MISPRLLDLVACPDCGGRLTAADGRATCAGCGRAFAASAFLDLRPGEPFAEQTKYLDAALHADARHEAIAPPVLGSRVRQRQLGRLLAPAAGDTIVDLGCGSGRTLAWNAASGAHLTGVDIAPYFAPSAVARFDLVLGDLRRLPLRTGAFTKAWSLDVLEHLSRSALVDMLAEANRVLADDGAFVVYSHVRRNGWPGRGVRAVNRLAAWCERRGWLDLSQERLRKSDHVNPLADHDDLQAVSTQAGFRIERVRYYSPVVGAFVENVLVRLAERILMGRARRRATGLTMDQARRLVRADGQARVGARGAVYALLVALSWIMEIDLLLFGRIPTGPFFARLRKVGKVSPQSHA